MGWVNASPEHKNPKRKAVSRRVKLLKRGVSLDPSNWGVDITRVGYLLEAMRELGWADTGGMGPSVLPFREIMAYGISTHQVFEAWETRALRSMSAAFIDGYTSKTDVEPSRWVQYAGALLPLVPITDDTAHLLPELEPSP